MIRILTFLAALFALAPTPVFAQAPVALYCFTTLTTPGNQWQPCTSTWPLAVSASVSATVTPFAPGGSFATLTSTASSADHALPTGATVALFNTGTTAVSCTLTIGAGVAVASENIIQASSWIGVAVGSNTHYSCINQAGDGASNVVVASGGTGLPTGSGGGGGGSSSITSWAGGTLGSMANYGTSPGAVLVPGVNAFVTNTNANGQATMANSSPVALASNQSVADPCMFQAKTNLAISQNGTSSVQLIALSGSTVIYVCSLSLVAAGATTVAITTGTGTACVTGNAAVIGTTTASIANSMSFAANGGMTLGNGGSTIAKGAASSELCMILGTSVFVSGNLTYVQQ